jgi:hypothetical protein
MTDMMTAFVVMADDVTFVNASREQIDGILLWHDRARLAHNEAGVLAAGRPCLDVLSAGARTHRIWRLTAQSVLAALAAQSEEAVRGRLAAEDDAARADAEEARARSDAAWLRRQAARAAARAAAARSSAGACAGTLAAAGFLAEAEAAAAEASDLLDSARTRETEAAEHRDEAAEHRELAGRLQDWEVLARDAHGTGTAVLDAEEDDAVRLGELAAAGGGPAELPGDKSYLAAASAGPVPLMAGDERQ